MPLIATKPRKQKDPIVNVMLNGGRVTAGFRAALFAAASRAGVSVNEFVLTAAAEKLRASGSQFSGVFEPGDLPDLNDNTRQEVTSREA
jgi:hypothetical protein